MAADTGYPIASRGTTLQRWSRGPTQQDPWGGESSALELLGDVRSISFSGISATEIDVTALIHGAKQYILGTQDGGTVTVQAFVNTGQPPPVPTSGNSTPNFYRFHTPPTPAPLDTGYSVQLLFAAYLQATAMTAATDEAVQVTYTLRITGPVIARWGVTNPPIPPELPPEL